MHTGGSNQSLMLIMLWHTLPQLTDCCETQILELNQLAIPNWLHLLHELQILFSILLHQLCTARLLHLTGYGLKTGN